MSIEAMKQALEALELALRSHGVMLLSDPPQDAWKTYGVEVNARQAITALRTAIEQAEKSNIKQVIHLYDEPPAAPVQDIEHCIWARNGNTPCPKTAAQRQWVSLTDEEIDAAFAAGDGTYAGAYHAIEAKLREKNGGAM